MPGPDARTPDNGPGEMSTATAPTATVHSGVEAKAERKLTVLETHGYTLGRTIGSGSYATVKVAKSDRHNCNVAIKIISKFQAPGDYLKKFLPREIEVVKGLKHENLIRFLQAIETTHRVYIVMEYAENGSLLDIIRKDQHIDEVRGRRWFRQLVEAVDYCHERGVVHRDIKCENLLMDHGLNIKLSDFGFARGHMKPKNGVFSLSETFCGSYAYASPEILKGVPYRPQDSDIWSMGVVLYAIVYGRLPFDDTNYTQLLKQVQNKVSFPREPKVSTECRKLITKILAPLKIRVKIPQILADPWLNPTQPPAKEDSNDATERVKFKVFQLRQAKLPIEGQKLMSKMLDMLKINVKNPQLFPDLKLNLNPQSGDINDIPEQVENVESFPSKVMEKFIATLKKMVKIPRYLAELWLSSPEDYKYDGAIEDKAQFSKEEIKSATIGTLTFDRKLEEVK